MVDCPPVWDNGRIARVRIGSLDNDGLKAPEIEIPTYICGLVGKCKISKLWQLEENDGPLDVEDCADSSTHCLTRCSPRWKSQTCWVA